MLPVQKLGRESTQLQNMFDSILEKEQEAKWVIKQKQSKRIYEREILTNFSKIRKKAPVPESRWDS